MNNKFSLKKLVILVTILAVPGFLYYLLQEKGKNRYRPLSFFGPKQVASTFHTVRGKQIPDTLYHKISNFQLLNQFGDSVKFKTDSSKITVVNFFYTRCPSFCDNMNKELARVVDNFKKNPFLQFFSISVDPSYDTAEILNKYSEKFGAKPPKWQFLTGGKEEIFKLAHKDFLVDAVVDTTQEHNIIHSPLFILVDTQKRIRGFYNSTDKEQVDKLIDEVKVLIAEELRKVKNR
ncbi:SCO family protein [Rubrolithibacter danxiaensis]|uniref:SCO family protein n=1 Tax=Rubrolithibacter danxiaensis TaxID=3390805 RepID=UPI003BF7ABEF